MTITLPPELEERLREKALQEGSEVDAVAEALIVAALEWEAQEQEEVIEAVRTSEQAAKQGRERPIAEFVAEQRAKHRFETPWRYRYE